jgi:peptide/nickel transport system substrate-binding protein
VKPLPYDPEGAASLLEEAGWKDTDGDGIREKNGQKLSFELLSYNSPTLINILAGTTDYMKKIGVETTLRPLEWASFMNRLHEKDFQASYLVWGVGADPDYQYNVWHSSQHKVGRNYGKYVNPKVDALFEKGRTTFDFEERVRIYQEIQRIMYEDQACLFLYHLPLRFSVHQRFKGVKVAPYDPFLSYPGIFGWWVPKELQKCR